MRQYIGIDLGGTNIKGALVSEAGEILKQRSVPTHAEAGAEAVTKAIAAMICQLAEGGSVSGVGMGCPGTVDDREGTVVYACNLGWVHYDVRTALRELTGCSVRLVNDANAAALAEEYPGDFARIIGLHTYSQSPHRDYDITLTGNWVERGGFRFEDFVLTRRKEEEHGND